MKCSCCGKFMRYELTNADLIDEYQCIDDCFRKTEEDFTSQEKFFDFIDKQNNLKR